MVPAKKFDGNPKLAFEFIRLISGRSQMPELPKTDRRVTNTQQRRDETHRASKQIIERERADQMAKSAKLKALRDAKGEAAN